METKNFKEKTTTILENHTYLIGYSKPTFIAKGLHAGLKERGGLPTSLPLVLEEGDEYVNAGYLDALPCGLIKETEIKNAYLYIDHVGEIKVSFYVLLDSGRIYHCSDYLLGENELIVEVPVSSWEDVNGKLIFFRIEPRASKAILNYWFYTIQSEDWMDDVEPVTLISRSLGESPTLINRYMILCQEYYNIKKRYPMLKLLPIPQLKVYESSQESYKIAMRKLKSGYNKHICLKKNDYNLGGGGNMCLAMYQEVIRSQKTGQFGMLDSDTILPFRTFYLASLKAALMAKNGESKVKVPIILYTREPNKVLESGALFGRGNWGIISEYPTQPCIQPLHNGDLISNSTIQAELSGTGYTDYPPFIFSLYSAPKKQIVTHFLPTPFFLRGDDIEMGQHLRRANISCEIDGSLLVFQEPKHSLWHEWMAILHGTCLVLTAAALEKRCGGGFPDLEVYFESRCSAHALIHDLNGLRIYERVLDRLSDLMTWSKDEIVPRFHDPITYLEARRLNAPYTEPNFCMIKSMTSKRSTDAGQIMQLPFLYFEAEYNAAIQKNPELPPYIAMINQSQKTAAILEPRVIKETIVQATVKRIRSKAKHLFGVEGEELAQRCLLVTDRNRIVEQYLNKYSSEEESR